MLKWPNILLKKKADINRKTQSSRTPLHLACEQGHISMVKLLLFMGADYTLTNFYKYGTVTTRETPRDVAISCNNMKIVELLDKYDEHIKNKAKQNEKEESEKQKEESEKQIEEL